MHAEVGIVLLLAQSKGLRSLGSWQRPGGEGVLRKNCKQTAQNIGRDGVVCASCVQFEQAMAETGWAQESSF